DEKEKQEKPMATVMVWDAIKAEKKKAWEHPAKQVKKLVFLPDNKSLIGHFTGKLVAWDATSGAKLPKIAHVVGTSFDLDAAGKILTTADGPRVLDFATSEEKYDLDTGGVLRHVALSADGKLMIASPERFTSSSPRLLRWDLTTGKERTVPEAHRHFI